MSRLARFLVAAPCLVFSACASTERAEPPPSGGAGSAMRSHTAADVAFMQGMIHHHAQALLMTRWAGTHGASERLLLLAERIDVSQRDEIALMSRWLEARDLPVPNADPDHTMHMGHNQLMPGMLTAEQLAVLDAARGAEFDRLFLTLMIQHHRGAITMAEELFASPGGGQEETIFRFASDVFADQQAEIDRMQQMLDTMNPGGS